MSVQFYGAILAVIAYGFLCWFYLGRGKSRVPNLNEITDDTLLVAYASQSGQAEQLAHQYALFIKQNQSIQQKHSVIVVNLNQVDKTLIEKTSLALFIVSTYGEGEPPDNGLRFQQQFLRKADSHQSFSQLRFAVLALGDSEYRHYCGFGLSLDEYLQSQGAAPLFETVKVDKLNPTQLQQWQQHLITNGLIASDNPASVRESPFLKGMLVEQKCLNPDSPGAPAFLIRIRPPSECHWQAGDVVEIQPYNDSELSTREYSIASIPDDGSIDLLVRQVCKEDGSFGLGSGWLTKEAKLSDDIEFRIRSNPNFHVPDSNVPMICIGNGTGIAGLRALLKQRIQSQALQNCLFFGERTQAHDFFFSDEINNWQQSNCLPLVHLAFSRDQEERRYVQDLLPVQAHIICDWVAKGGAIYVCGSLEGMAGGVDHALQAILGREKVLELKMDGRYCRDVY